MIPQIIAKSKKKIYTIAPGEYSGVWHGSFCWLHKPQMPKGETVIFARIDTNKNSKKRENVRVIIKTPNAYIYETTKQFVKNGMD